jgi:chloramphenicol 3-O-phosphotransferase
MFTTTVNAAGDPTISRRNLFPSASKSSPEPARVQLQATGPPAGGCVQPPLTNTTWIQLGIDNYLANLPNGTSLNLQVSYKSECLL